MGHHGIRFDRSFDSISDGGWGTCDETRNRPELAWHEHFFAACVQRIDNRVSDRFGSHNP